MHTRARTTEARCSDCRTRRQLFEVSNHSNRVFDKLLHVVEELGDGNTINNAVICAEAHLCHALQAKKASGKSEPNKAGSNSIGSSRHAATLSHLHDLTGNNLAVFIKARELSNSAHCANSNLGNNNHGPKVCTTQNADIGQSKRATTQMFRLELSLCAKLLQAAACATKTTKDNKQETNQQTHQSREGGDETSDMKSTQTWSSLRSCAISKTLFEFTFLTFGTRSPSGVSMATLMLCVAFIVTSVQSSLSQLQRERHD